MTERVNSKRGRNYATVAQAAEYLHTSTRTIYNMLDDGRLTPYRGLGSSMLRVDLDEIDEKMRG